MRAQARGGPRTRLFDSLRPPIPLSFPEQWRIPPSQPASWKLFGEEAPRAVDREGDPPPSHDTREPTGDTIRRRSTSGRPTRGRTAFQNAKPRPARVSPRIASPVAP